MPCPAAMSSPLTIRRISAGAVGDARKPRPRPRARRKLVRTAEMVAARKRLSKRALDDFLGDEAPAPGFARLEGPDDGVLDLPKVLRRVLVLRVVAAADVPATETKDAGAPSRRPSSGSPHIRRRSESPCGFDRDARIGPWLFSVQARSSAARSQPARSAPAAYVVCRKSRMTSRGDAACRTCSYIRRNSLSCGS